MRTWPTSTPGRSRSSSATRPPVSPSPATATPNPLRSAKGGREPDAVDARLQVGKGPGKAAADDGKLAQVSFSFKSSVISVNVTPILPRRFIRGSLAQAQATLPLNAYAFPPITIDPLTCVPGDGTRINSAQKPPAETSLVKAELTPASPAFKSILQRRRSLGFDLCFLCTVTSITKVSSPFPGPRRRSPRDLFCAALGPLSSADPRPSRSEQWQSGVKRRG